MHIYSKVIKFTYLEENIMKKKCLIFLLIPIIATISGCKNDQLADKENTNMNIYLRETKSMVQTKHRYANQLLNVNRSKYKKK